MNRPRRTRALSLQVRLLAAMTIVAVVLVGVCAVITVTIRGQLIDQVDQRLGSLSPGGPGPGGIRPDWIDGAGGPEQPPTPPTERLPERISDVFQGFVDSDGDLVTVFSPNFAGVEHAAPAIETSELPELPARLTVPSEDGTTTYRVLVQDAGEVLGVTGVPIDDVTATIRRLVGIEVAGAAAILVVLAVVAWWVVRLGIRPVKEMTRTAAAIADGDLGVRVPEVAPGTESGELAVALNRMLGRIEEALDERSRSEDRLRQFVADASHELRTPVTSIRGYAELYRHGGLRTSEELADAMRRTEQEAARMGRLVDDMLTLARLDRERPLALAPVDLCEVVRDVVADARVREPGRTVTVDAEAPVEVVGDDDHLRQAIANVVANALVHTDGDVHVRCAAVGPGALVEVVDRGEGMAPEVSHRVTERFYREDRSRSRARGGSGLGLSIVDAVLRAHGGSLEITSAPGRGTSVRMHVPDGHGTPCQPVPEG